VDLKGLLEFENSSDMIDGSDFSSDQGLNLFFLPKQPVTLTEILNSIPPRDVVDRLVSKYFNVMDMALGM
jgi:hypothetical protein